MLRYKISHVTSHSFPDQVSLLPHTLRLRPREVHELRIEDSRLKISPAAHMLWYRDAEENSVARATFDTKTRKLTINSQVIIQKYDIEPLNFLVADYAVDYPFSYQKEDEIVLSPYRLASKNNNGTLLQERINTLWTPTEKLQSYALLQRLNRNLFESLKQVVREEEGVQSAEQTLSLQSGSCRDFANVFMVIARQLGFAARFVSGYLYLKSSTNQPGATHAWVEVFLPGAGWKGFDPTTGDMTGADHITVAVARLPESVPPVAGSYLGAPGATMQVGVWIDALDA